MRIMALLLLLVTAGQPTARRLGELLFSDDQAPLGCLAWLVGPLTARRSVDIRVDSSKALGSYKPIYAYFGYDEPNYTYMPNGKKLIRELASLSDSPVYIRTHFLLATGDGSPGLKWGSTNAYAEDGSGKPIYDWTIVDRILATYLDSGAKPFVEIGFMPQVLSSKPDPYKPTWVPGAKNDQYSIGWTYPPKDYAKWGALVNEWVKHAVAKWGKEEVSSWYWEVWNEPDISYWHGTPEEYDKLYDYAADGVKRALPSARIGGPASTGPASPRAAAFLRQFLEHCSSGKNYVKEPLEPPSISLLSTPGGGLKMPAPIYEWASAKKSMTSVQGSRLFTRSPRSRTCR